MTARILQRVLLPVLLLLMGCAQRLPLSARSEYLSANYLASTQVRTPEPCYPCFLGEQVVVSWHIPRTLSLEKSSLLFQARLSDHELEEVRVPLESYEGFWIYRILNEEYKTHGGILSYSARVVQGEEVLYRFDHKLWQDIIPEPRE